MEVHQSLPAQYLHNPYLVKTEQPPSAPSTPPNEDITHTVTQQRRPANGPGRPLTADRKRPYNCNMCSSRFGSKMELEEHQNSHTGQKPFECNNLITGRLLALLRPSQLDAQFRLISTSQRTTATIVLTPLTSVPELISSLNRLRNLKEGAFT
ncbi:PR domain zinc finger protein 5 [Toxocara canis]|uniref:PR domain zinc finger protein 5 n=1 Tax=Toxocara canis TaxID=6265 RepID=A0A0B2VXG7_TOXCA|nr:PR domain zinc finger protein 5 [Toxocara canis]